ncbi:MAG: GTP 3',8-cyclase MoaA [Halarsenatibacteraceae bacterium]
MAINASYQREVDYLRISVTDRCNFRCKYCMPPDGVDYKPHAEIMRYEEILIFAKIAVEAGVKRIRLTGGEPLVRKGLDKLIYQLNKLEGLEDISLTTNGYLLTESADRLAKAGLDRINVSLDTLDREKFKEISLVDGLSEVLAGLKAARNAGLNPIKLNTVLIRGFNDNEVLDFIKFTKANNYNFRFIEFMPLNGSSQANDNKYISIDEIKAKIKAAGFKLTSTEISGGGPATSYQIDDTQATVGFISPISHSFCSSCNRLRLTSDGKLRPCLAMSKEYNLYDQAGKLLPEEKLKAVLNQACSLKPDQHDFANEEDYGRNMSQIGG